MAPRTRRSSRLREGSDVARKSISSISGYLSGLAERDESPMSVVQSNLDTIVSPRQPAPTTPAARRHAKPALEEMHPSKAHHSTTKEPDSGLRLGFADIHAKGSNQPSGIIQNTPAKGCVSAFRPDLGLGPDAQRMMSELREEALRIKVKLAAEQEEGKRRAAQEVIDRVGNRKIAQVKGNAGRFSDIHMAEFKRMDSIAGHPSSFRTQQGHLAPPTKRNLKRSQSTAKLDESEDTHTIEQTAERLTHTDEAEASTPAKRQRHYVADDTSSSRPVSQVIKETVRAVPSMSTVSRSQSSLLSSITTPTQASLARAANTKASVTQVPSLSRSPSKPKLEGTNRLIKKSATMNNISSVPRSEPKNFLLSPGRFDRVKSILRYPGSNAKRSVVEPPSVSSATEGVNKPNFDKALPPLPTTPGRRQHSKPARRVNFTPDTVDRHAETVQSQAFPIKSIIPVSASKTNIGIQPPPAKYPKGARPELKEVHYPSVGGDPSLSNKYKEVSYPSLAYVHPLPQAPRLANSESHPPPSVPGTFTFRSDHTINFGASPNGFGSSYGQASVRQVRPSIFPSSMPGSFPGGNKENFEATPFVPDRVSSKKRRRVSSDDEREREDVEPSPKKQKAYGYEASKPMGPRPQAGKMPPKTKIPSPVKRRNVLSMSRLNMLARPKVRK